MAEDEIRGSQTRQTHISDETAPQPTPENGKAESKSTGGIPIVLKVLLYIAAVLAASFALSLFAWLCAGDVLALSKPDREVEVVLTDGDTIDSVTDQLKEKGLIEFKWLFKIYCAITKAEGKLSAGTFKLNNVYDYHAIVNGLQATAQTRDTVRVMVPEGYNCDQIFTLLEEKGVCPKEDLESTAAGYMFDYDFLQELPYGAANRLEGYMFPDTYLFYVGDRPERVINKFLSNFEVKFTEELQADIELLNAEQKEKMEANGFTAEEIEAAKLDMAKIVIVASMIERETGGVAESATIASVIYNRLSSKIYPLLQIDAALRYGLDKWADPLTAEDFSVVSPYNTHKYPGLPAGPISNPGLDSIRAALYPKDTDYYFYALNPKSGQHHFTENYYEHQAYIEELNANG